MAETSTIFGFMKYVSATDILSDFKKTVDSHFVNSLKWSRNSTPFFFFFVFFQVPLFRSVPLYSNRYPVPAVSGNNLVHFENE